LWLLLQSVGDRGVRLSRWIAASPKWTWAVAVGALVIIIAAGVALSRGNGGSVAQQDSTYSQHPEDVKVVSCRESGGHASAELRVTNSSPNESNYAVLVSFQAPDGQTIYSSQTVVVTQLASGATSAVTPVQGAKLAAGLPLSCVVTRAARYGT
jgi:hypothetical protein